MRSNDSDGLGPDLLVVQGLDKSFHSMDPGEDDRMQVLRDLSFSLRAGSFTTVFGPNGCGKTTLLGIVAGILPPDQGRVMVAGHAPSEAKIGYVFQDFPATLFPWKRAIDNIAYPLRLRGTNWKEAREHAQLLLDRFSIRLPVHNYPYQLSGGQKQMTCIARAIVNDPVLLLLDEPLSALDYEVRSSMQQKILEIWAQAEMTVLFVSHELDEAIYLADKVIFMTQCPGRILRVLDVTLPRPRRPEMLSSGDFSRLRAEGLETFREALDS